MLKRQLCLLFILVSIVQICDAQTSTIIERTRREQLFFLQGSKNYLFIIPNATTQLQIKTATGTLLLELFETGELNLVGNMTVGNVTTTSITLDDGVTKLYDSFGGRLELYNDNGSTANVILRGIDNGISEMEALDLNNTGSTNAGLRIGGDTQIYRGEANQLVTSDSFNIGKTSTQENSGAAIDIIGDVSASGGITAATFAGDGSLLTGTATNLSASDVFVNSISTANTDSVTNEFQNHSDFRRVSFQAGTRLDITSAADQLTANYSVLMVSPDASYVMSASPQIMPGTQGQIFFVHNISQYDITFQDISSRSGSGIEHKGEDAVVQPGDIITFMYMTTDNAWHVQSHPNIIPLLGDQSVLNVRNTSGGSISGLIAVYDTGYNSGQERITIDVADNTNSSKMPSIGITSVTIGNNANGVIVESGVLDGVNTSSFSTGDALYVSNTGALTNTVPTTDIIQRIGTVLRSHASKGVILITAAGPANVPNDIETQSLVLSATMEVRGAANFTGALIEDTDAEDLVLRTNSNANQLVLDSGGGIGLGTTSPDGTLHVFKGSAGAVTAIGAGDGLVVENSAQGGISILVPDGSSSDLIFGSPSDNLGAKMEWTYNTGILTIGTQKSGAEISIEIANGTESFRIAEGEIRLATTGGSIDFVKDISPDHTWSGNTAVLTAGEALTIGQVVFYASDGDMELADASLSAKMPAMAMSTGTIASGAKGTFLLDGFFRDDTWSWTTGAPVYVSTTSGAVTQATPTLAQDQLQVLGIATSADEIHFRPDLTLVEIK